MIIKRILLISLAFILSSENQFLISQTFERTYQADSLIFPCHDINFSFGLDIEPIGDSFIALSRIIPDYSENCQSNSPVGYSIQKIDEYGDTIFSKTFLEESYFIDGFGSIYVYELLVASDSSIYVAGDLQSNFADTVKMYIAKHSFDGSLIWSKTFSNDYINQAQILFEDSGFIYVGGKISPPFGSSNSPMVMKLDTEGQLIWHHIIPNTAFADMSNILKIADSFYFIGSVMQSAAANNNYRIFVASFDSSGDFQPSQYYGINNYSYILSDALINTNGNIVISAHENHTSKNIVLEIDSSLNVISQFYVPELSAQDIYMSNCILQSTDSNYFVLGNKNYLNSFVNAVFTSSIYIQKINPSGQLLWEREYSGLVYDCISHDDNGLVLIGARQDTVHGIPFGMNTLIIKVDSTGNSNACSLDFYLHYYLAEETDSIPMGAVVYPLNNSFGPGPFEWYVNDTLLSTDFNTYFFTSQEEGWLTIELRGCNTLLSDSLYVYDPTLGVNRSNVALSVNVYPNPSTDYVHFEFKQQSSEPSCLRVLSLDGKLFYTEKFIGKTRIEINDWPSGIYIYELMESPETSSRGKFIKN